MPRLTINNPTRRILRLLEEFDQLEAAYDEMATKLAWLNPSEFEKLLTKPPLTALAQERLRQQLMGRRTETARLNMQRVRLRRGVEPRSSGLTAAQEEAIRLEIEAGEIADVIGIKADKGT